MPITRDQFEKGLDNTAYRILQFLGENSDKAYDVVEVVKGIGEWNPPEDSGGRLLFSLGITFAIGGYLDDLVNKGLVDKKAFGAAAWYSIHNK